MEDGNAEANRTTGNAAEAETGKRDEMERETFYGKPNDLDANIKRKLGLPTKRQLVYKDKQSGTIEAVFSVEIVDLSGGLYKLEITTESDRKESVFEDKFAKMQTDGSGKEPEAKAAKTDPGGTKAAEEQKPTTPQKAVRKELDYRKIGYKLRALRGDRTQAEVSEKTGLSIVELSQYENGHRIPTLKKMLIIADFYGEPAEEIFTITK